MSVLLVLVRLHALVLHMSYVLADTFGYNFRPWPKSISIASGGEILNYLGDTIEEDDLAPVPHSWLCLWQEFYV